MKTRITPEKTNKIEITINRSEESTHNSIVGEMESLIEYLDPVEDATEISNLRAQIIELKREHVEKLLIEKRRRV